VDGDRQRSEWYRDGRYVNLDGATIPAPGSFGRFLRWRLSGRTAPELESARNVAPEPIVLDRRPLHEPKQALQLSWLGHATVLMQLDGVSVLTDPIFGRVARVAVRRLGPPPIRPDELPHLDVIAVSHNHYDHLDVPSLRALRKLHPEALVLAPSGLAVWLRKRLGDPVRALEWWDAVRIGSVEVVCVPAQHWSTRAIGDRLQTHWCGWLVRSDSGSAYMAGDTGFGPHFQAIAERFGPIDAAALPIGGYAPRWFMRDQHIGPAEAVEAARILSASTLFPMHWGTYRLTDEPIDEPALLVRREAERAGQPLALLRPGGLWSATVLDGEWKG
jgi:L-ascorbate metabolism protein UlaG (beta-lactamase superfamily)